MKRSLIKFALTVASASLLALSVDVVDHVEGLLEFARSSLEVVLPLKPVPPGSRNAAARTLSLATFSAGLALVGEFLFILLTSIPSTIVEVECRPSHVCLNKARGGKPVDVEIGFAISCPHVNWARNLTSRLLRNSDVYVSWKRSSRDSFRLAKGDESYEADDKRGHGCHIRIPIPVTHEIQRGHSVNLQVSLDGKQQRIVAHTDFHLKVCRKLRYSPAPNALSDSDMILQPAQHCWMVRGLLRLLFRLRVKGNNGGVRVEVI